MVHIEGAFSPVPLIILQDRFSQPFAWTDWQVPRIFLCLPLQWWDYRNNADHMGIEKSGSQSLGRRQGRYRMVNGSVAVVG